MFSDHSGITYKFVTKRLKENLQMFRKKASDLQITHKWHSVNILNLLPMKRHHVRIYDGLTQCPEEKVGKREHVDAESPKGYITKALAVSVHIMSFSNRVTWVAQSVKLASLELRVVSSSPLLGMEPTLKKKRCPSSSRS